MSVQGSPEADVLVFPEPSPAFSGHWPLWPERSGVMTLVIDKMLRRPAVEELTALSRSTIYELLRTNRFPHPVRLGPRAVGWRHSDIVAWLSARPIVRYR